MLERGPSIQKLSELQTMKGAAPSSGRAFLHAAAGIEQPGALVGDDDPRAAPAGEMRFHRVGEVVDVDDDGVDAGLCQPVEHMVERACARRPRSGAWAVVSVIGRMRLPRPAASSMARLKGRGGTAASLTVAGSVREDEGLVPQPDLGQHRMGERAVEIGADRAGCAEDSPACRRAGRGGRRCRGSWSGAARP